VLLLCLWYTNAYSLNHQKSSEEKDLQAKVETAAMEDAKDEEEGADKEDNDEEVPLEDRDANDDADNDYDLNEVPHQLPLWKPEPVWEIDEDDTPAIERTAKSLGLHVEGADELLTDEQEEELNAPAHPNDRKRNIVKSKNRRWPKMSNGRVRIPYIISFWGPGTKGNIKEAAKLLSKNTCIDWVPKTSSDTNYVKFISKWFGGCWSQVGRSGGKQQINLGFGCGSDRVVRHEMGHAMGFHHEQSRTDRDEYVKILWNNIKSDRKGEFKKYSNKIISSYGIPWDWDSVMLYDSKAFQKWFWQNTMLNRKTNKGFGSKSTYSHWDFEGLNRLYECKK